MSGDIIEQNHISDAESLIGYKITNWKCGEYSVYRETKK